MVFLGGLAVQAAGCSEIALRPAREHVPTSPPVSWDLGDWSSVLRENVEDGLVDYENLAEHREALDRFLGQLSVAGPTGTPGLFAARGDRVAYWINAYNALVLRAVLERYPTGTLFKLTGPAPERDYVFPVDGRLRSLLAVRKELEAEAGGDARVLFCLCSGAKGSPPLADEPYYGFDLDRRVEEAARKATGNWNLVRIDHVGRKLLVCLDLFSRRDRVVGDYEQRYGTQSVTLLTVLNGWADPQTRGLLSSARGYRVSAIPFDRTLNDTGDGTAVQAASR